MSTKTTNESFSCVLVADSRVVQIPPQMGSPRPDQMQGTPHEQLSEIACRICYDSMGTGRTSKELHEHLAEVKHYSVYEHGPFTVQFNGTPALNLLPALVNRPGCWVEFDVQGALKSDVTLRVTANLRTVLDFQKIKPAHMPYYKDVCLTLQHFANQLAPSVVRPLSKAEAQDCAKVLDKATLETPRSKNEQWISVYMKGSRGFSHEQVRHGDFTAISQRSTRYCDETGSVYCLHPLILAYQQDVGEHDSFLVMNSYLDSIAHDRHAYKTCVEHLQSWLIERGLDKTSARKQARGAARGFLGNALQTELIFSASVAQWFWMLHERCSDTADAEIRLVYNEVLTALRSSQRFGYHFADLKTKPAKDGIGFVIDWSNP